MGSVHIRDARIEDVDRCREIDVLGDEQFAAAGHPEFLGGGSLSDEAASAAIAESRMLVAELNGRVVGWVYLGRDDGELAIGQIAVDPTCQRRGVGSTLLSHVISVARSTGETSIVLNTQGDVPWNQPWYQRFGFQVVDQSSWTPAMRAITAEQTAAGLHWTTRVHMRLSLGSWPI